MPSTQACAKCNAAGCRYGDGFGQVVRGSDATTFGGQRAKWVIAFEAAHIKWFQAGGPDVEQNGLALCSLHHKVFDLGAFTIRPADYVMVFSQHLVGNAEKLLSYHGAGIQLPQSASYLPRADFLDWHEDQVFKKPGRDAI